MRLHVLAPLLFALLAACATPPAQRPAVQRPPAREAPVSAAAPAPKVTLDDIVAMVKAGDSGDAIVNRIRNSASRIRLAAADVISLRDRGVPLGVIDQIMELERSAQQVDLAEQINQRDAACAEELRRHDQACIRQCNNWCGPYAPAWGPGFQFWFGR